jgi:hypothetical protein
LIFLFISCEGMRIPEGTVLDKSTGKALDSVRCTVIETGENLLTDSTGKFYLEGPFGSCMRECKEVSVQFSKEGYQTLLLINPEQDFVYLVN